MEERIVQVEEKPDDDAQKISVAVSTLLGLSIKAEYLHLKAKSLPAHEVLGDLYELLHKFGDDLFECAVGSGTVPDEEGSGLSQALSVTSPEEMFAMASFVCDSMSELGSDPITKLASDFSADISKIAYKLSMC